jgi:DMSO/TMAO reductase YedYZ molybdopterin-dependent catalytic subunit
LSKAGRGFWSGVGAGSAFVVIALLARVFARIPTIPELIQDRLVLLLPGRLFAFLLDRLLYLGKPLLFLQILLITVVAGGLLGIAVARWGHLLPAALLVWAATGLLLFPAAGHGVFAGSIGIALTLALGMVAYVLAFRYFFDLRSSSQPHSTEPSTEQGSGQTGRRKLIVGVTLGAVSLGLAWRVLGRGLRPASGGPGENVNAGGLDVVSPLSTSGSERAGLPPAITPVKRFYVVSKNLQDPELSQDKWGVRIDGLVNRAVTLGFDDISALPAVETERTLECISNEVGGDLISNGTWRGARLADVLRMAELKPDASALFFTSADGYTSSLPVPIATHPDTLLVYALDGERLTFKHGFPARVLSFGIYGMKNPKWVTRIEAVDADRLGYWQQQGWDQLGIIQTMSVITSPDDRAVITNPGTLEIAGIAFAGSRGIKTVEVSTDGAVTWHEAELLPSLGDNTWTLWRYVWNSAKPGGYAIAARATDGTGTVQSARRTDPFPAGATGYHQIRLQLKA